MNTISFQSQTKYLCFVDSSDKGSCEYHPVKSLRKSFYGSLLAVIALLINFSILDPAWAGTITNPPTQPFPNPNSLNLSGVPGQTVSGNFFVDGSSDGFPIDFIVSGTGGDVTPNPITSPGNVTYRFTIPESKLPGTTLSAEINFFFSGGDDVQVSFAFVSVTITVEEPFAQPIAVPDSLNLSGVPGQTVSGDFLVEGSFPIDFNVSGVGGDVTPNPITSSGNATYRFTIPESELPGTTLSAQISLSNTVSSDLPSIVSSDLPNIVSVTITVEEPLAQSTAIPNSLNLSGVPGQTVSSDFLVEGSFPVDFSVSGVGGDVTPNPMMSTGNATYRFTIPESELPGTTLSAQISLSNTVSSDLPNIVSITITVEEPIISADDTPETANQLERDSAQTHNFERQGDEDWFTFAGEVNEQSGQPGTDEIFRRQFSIRLFNLGSLSTPIVEIYDTDGEFLMLSIDTRGVDDTILSFIVPVDGNYFVRVFNSSPDFGLNTEYSLELTSASSILSAIIEGKVIDKGNNDQPLEGVIVSPKPNGLSVKTNASGMYVTFLNLGTFDLEADLDGYDRSTVNITIENSEGQQVDDIALTPIQDGGNQIEVDSSFSGAWYDLTHDGEGFLLEILADNEVVIYWFTYDTSGNQAWIQGFGDINGNTISITKAIIPTGGIFGPDFDPDNVVRTPWGSLTFIFNDCNTGVVSYTGIPEFSSGSLNLQRLTSISGLKCGEEPRPEGQGLDRITGSWFDLTHDGEGYVIEILDSSMALIYWFSYDTNGNQAWFFETGVINGNTITVTDAQITNGGIFGSAFDPDDVDKTTWGSFTFTFNDCGSGTVDYTGPLEFGSDSLNLVRLSALGGYDCNFLSP